MSPIERKVKPLSARSLAHFSNLRSRINRSTGRPAHEKTVLKYRLEMPSCSATSAGDNFGLHKLLSMYARPRHARTDRVAEDRGSISSIVEVNAIEIMSIACSSRRTATDARSRPTSRANECRKSPVIAPRALSRDRTVAVSRSTMPTRWRSRLRGTSKTNCSTSPGKSAEKHCDVSRRVMSPGRSTACRQSCSTTAVPDPWTHTNTASSPMPPCRGVARATLCAAAENANMLVALIDLIFIEPWKRSPTTEEHSRFVIRPDT